MDNIQLVNDTIVNINNGKFNRTTLELINTFQKNERDICMGRLYMYYYLPEFNIPHNEYIETIILIYLNQQFATRTSNFNKDEDIFKSELLVPEKYRIYNSIYENVKYKCFCIRTTNKNDIINYPVNQYITSEFKIEKMFSYTGNLLPFDDMEIEGSTNHNLARLEFIKDIINNKENLDECYEDIITKYCTKSPHYKSGVEYGIPILNMKIAEGYSNFIIILNKLIQKKIYVSLNIPNFITHITLLINQIDNEILRNVINFNIALLNCNSNKDIVIQLLANYLKDYQQEKTFINFINIATRYYTLIAVNELLQFLEDNIEFTRKMANYQHMKFIFAILFRAFAYMIKSSDSKKKHSLLYEVLDTTFFNPIMKYDSFNNKYSFLLHRIEEDNEEQKRLKDSDDKTICVICLDNLCGKVILCISCNKYVGHPDCIKKSAEIYKKCPYCNKSF